jgi:hypothetical protein
MKISKYEVGLDLDLKTTRAEGGKRRRVLRIPGLRAATPKNLTASRLLQLVWTKHW